MLTDVHDTEMDMSAIGPAQSALSAGNLRLMAALRTADSTAQESGTFKHPRTTFMRQDRTPLHSVPQCRRLLLLSRAAEVCRQR